MSLSRTTYEAKRIDAAAALRRAATAFTPQASGRVNVLPGLRVVLALYAPLLAGLAVGDVGSAVPIAVGALVGGLVDPGGARSRRVLTIAVTAVLGATAFELGDLLGGNPALAIGYITLLLFGAGLSPEFGAAGIRGGLYVGTLGLLGVSSAGIDPGWIDPAGLLLGAVWAIALAAGPFHQGGQPVMAAAQRASRFTNALVDHMLLRTAIGRHAARLAVAGGLGIALSLALGRGHVGWIAAAALAVLHPRVSAHGERGVRLLAGTVVGALGVALLLQQISPGPVLLAIAAPALLLAVGMRNVDYIYYTVLYTAFMMALTAFSHAPGWALFHERVLDTVLGIGVAALVAWVSMPHGERRRLGDEVAGR